MPSRNKSYLPEGTTAQIQAYKIIIVILGVTLLLVVGLGTGIGLGVSRSNSGSYSEPSCSTGFRENTETESGEFECLKNVCTCNNGYPATDRDCLVHGLEVCGTCELGYYLKQITGQNGQTQIFCEKNVCLCDNGVLSGAVSRCFSHNSQFCESCQPGYRLESQECLKNVCDCENGVNDGGLDCLVDAVDFCSSCNPTYHLSGDRSSCDENICTCSNGQVTDFCQNHNENHCGACDNGYSLEEPDRKNCLANNCDCINGIGKTNGNCNDPNVESDCASCDNGFHSLNFVKPNAVTICSNSTQISSDFGFHLTFDNGATNLTTAAFQNYQLEFTLTVNSYGDRDFKRNILHIGNSQTFLYPMISFKKFTYSNLQIQTTQCDEQTLTTASDVTINTSFNEGITYIFKIISQNSRMEISIDGNVIADDLEIRSCDDSDASLPVYFSSPDIDTVSADVSIQDFSLVSL